MIDPNGYESVNVYDGFGRLVEARNERGVSTVKYAWTSALDIDGLTLPAKYRRVTTRDGAADTIEFFDSRQSLVLTDSPGVSDGNSSPRLLTTFVRDWRGNVTQQSEPHGPSASPVWTVTAYDMWGRVETVDSPLGRTQLTRVPIVRFAGQFPEWAFPDAVELILQTDPEQKEKVRVLGPNGLEVATADGTDVGVGDTGNTTRILRGGKDLPAVYIDPEGNEMLPSKLTS